MTDKEKQAVQKIANRVVKLTEENTAMRADIERITDEFAQVISGLMKRIDTLERILKVQSPQMSEAEIALSMGGLEWKP